MKVLAPTTAFPRFSGDVNGTFILDMFKRLNDIEFKVVAPSDVRAPLEEKIENIFVERVSYMPHPKYQRLTYGEGIHVNLQKSFLAKVQVPMLGITLLKTISKDLKKYDLVHAQMVFAGFAAYMARFITGKKTPIIVSFYGKDILNCKQNFNLYRPMLKNIELILALSKDMEKMLIDIGIDKNKIKVHHLGIDCKKFSYKKPSVSKNEIRFLSVARFIEKKGIDYGIKAFAKVVKKYPKCKLSLVGDGPQLAYLMNLTKDLKLEKNVEFINNLKAVNPRQVTFDEFNKADIFLLPSITTTNDYGGTPIVLMEAQARGIPCVVFEDAGNSEIVLDGKTGFVVEQKNIEKLAEKMIDLAENPKLRQKFSIEGRNYILKEFNNDVQTRNLESIYHETLKNR
ncbi:MAG: glycosyltransferase [Nanoarchaeota archaeon]